MKDVTHYYNWAVVNDKFKQNPIFVSKENIKSFQDAGFNAEIVYYISDIVDRDQREVIENNIILQNTELPLKNFKQILDEDEKTSELQEIATETKYLFGVIENTETIPDSAKICFIVDLMKLYMASKPKACALDFNCKLLDCKQYEIALERASYCFTERRTTFENKMCYINDDKNKILDKKDLLKSVIAELKDKCTVEGQLKQLKQYNIVIQDVEEITNTANRDSVYYSIKNYFERKRGIMPGLFPQKVVKAVMEEMSYNQVDSQTIDLTNLSQEYSEGERCYVGYQGGGISQNQLIQQSFQKGKKNISKCCILS